MTVEEDLFKRLSTFPDLFALVGTRVYPGRMPDKVDYPAITFSLITDETPSCMGQDTDNVRARFQFDVWDTKVNFARATQVRKALKKALRRYGGQDTVLIETIFIMNNFNLYEDDTNLHHLVTEAEVNYIES